MGRPIKRYNTEFREYFERLVESLPQERNEMPRTTAMDESAKMLGVSVHTIKSWLRPKGGKSSFSCPKWRADMFKISLPPEVSGLNKAERKQLAEMLVTLRENDIMDPQAAKLFDKLKGDIK